jgi:hypothetical protein
MIQSELLKEKYRIQKLLSGESASIHEYLEHSHLAAKALANSYGFPLRYVEMPNKSLQPTR